MIIFLGTVIELTTVLGSVVISLNSIADAALEISKNGYKIAQEALNTFEKEQANQQKQNTNTLKKALATILLFIPGVNLIRAGKNARKLKKLIMKDPQIQKSIIPMTEEEKEQYAQLTNKLQRLSFTVLVIDNKNDDKELMGFIGNRPIVVDHALTTLYNEPLPALNYTFDEVKRLNAATNYSYRIGKIDGENVAIIGIPNPDSPVGRIQLAAEDYKITHTYEKMTEEEAQDKTFTVYPFMSKLDENVQMVIGEINQSRIDMAASEQASLDSTINPLEVTPSLTDKEGPKLVKTIK